MYNSTLCYIEDPQGNYLMLHRVKKKNDLNHDKWVGVGGKFEDGESPEECVLRETWEETGLTLTEYQYRGIVTFVSDQWETEYMHVFTATGWTGDKLFLDLIHEPDTPFFSMKLRYEGERLVYAALNGKELNT